MKRKLIKFKIKFLFLLVNLLRKSSVLVHSLFDLVDNLTKRFFLIITKISVAFIAPFYLKIKKIYKEILSNPYYQKEIVSLIIQKGTIFVVLFSLLVFIFFEKGTTFEEQFFAEALAFEKNQTEEISSDFKISSESLEIEEPIIKPNIIFEEKFVPTRTEIEKYIVKEGDTLSSIAEEFGVSLNTILWENKLTPRSIIRPGQVLKILPVSGVSHKVKKGDTLLKIAQFYKANLEDIIRFNNLEEEPLKEGDIIIIPEGKIPPPPPTPVYRIKDKVAFLGKGVVQKTRTGVNCRDFYPGQCTWYVAQRYCLTFSGHAKDWLANASKAGYRIGKTPQVGAIISLRETWYGHVGIVEEVKENTIVISEMNHIRPWVVNKRELNINDWRINGYIYP